MALMTGMSYILASLALPYSDPWSKSCEWAIHTTTAVANDFGVLREGPVMAAPHAFLTIRRAGVVSALPRREWSGGRQP